MRNDQTLPYGKAFGRLARRLLLGGVAIAVIAIFVSGAYFGRWASKNHLLVRAREALVGAIEHKVKGNPEIGGPWVVINTNLARIQKSVIQLPRADGNGGGIQPLDDGRIFYATRVGEFGVIGAGGVINVLPFRIEMNIEALKHHPVSRLESFNYVWFRVTGINLTRVDANHFELLVGHHYFDAKRQCVELRLSRGTLAVTANEVSLTAPFRTVMATNPCITFNHPDYHFAYEGHFSGGKIVRIGNDQVLFSTGDHGWVGLRGYPALAQDDASTLGKILLVNTSTNEVEVYAKGFRNPQGLTVDSKGRIWATEQGPQGGDELNLIIRGGNYGWPYSTYGTDYGPLPQPLNPVQGTHDFGVKPQFVWSPSIAVTNIIESTSAEFPLWNGDLLLTSLIGNAIHRLRLDGTRVIYDEVIRLEGNRLRDIIQLSDGRFAILTEWDTVIIIRNADAHGMAPYLDAKRQQRRTEDMSAEERAFAVAGRYASGQPLTDVGALQALTPAAARGRIVFQTRCGTCHLVSSSNTFVGPTLKGIVGRRVGSSPNFTYSGALTERHEAWSLKRIVEFAMNPSDMYAGSVMAPVDLTPDERRDLESYLDALGR